MKIKNMRVPFLFLCALLIGLLSACSTKRHLTSQEFDLFITGRTDFKGTPPNEYTALDFFPPATPFVTSFRDSLKIMYLSENWKELADEVIRISIDEDLMYYYLGSAAEGLNYLEAALKYYKKSNALYTNGNYSQTCMRQKSVSKRLVNFCTGIRLDELLPKRIQAVELAIQMRKNRPLPAVLDELPP